VFECLNLRDREVHVIEHQVVTDQEGVATEQAEERQLHLGFGIDRTAHRGRPATSSSQTSNVPRMCSCMLAGPRSSASTSPRTVRTTPMTSGSEGLRESGEAPTSLPELGAVVAEGLNVGPDVLRAVLNREHPLTFVGRNLED